MADSKVEILISVKDAASGMLGTISRATRAYHNTLKQTNGIADQTAASLKRLALQYLGLSEIKRGIEAGYRFNMMLEDTRTGLASLVFSMLKFRDANGRLIEGQEKFSEAMKVSADIQKRLRVEGLLTKATYEELTFAFQQAFVPAIEAGFNIDQVVKFTAAISKAAAAMNVPQNQLGEEIRSILSGNMTPKNTRLQPLMEAAGLSNKKIKELATQGKLFEAVMKAMEGAEEGAAAASNNLSVKLSNLKDAISQALGEGLKTGFSRTKQLIDDLTAKIVTVDQASKTITFNPKFINALRQIDQWAWAIVDGITEMIAAVKKFSQEHPVLVKFAVETAKWLVVVEAAVLAVRILGSQLIWMGSHSRAVWSVMRVLATAVLSPIRAMIPAMAAFNVRTLAAAGAMTKLGAAAGIVGAAILGWEMGKKLAEVEVGGKKMGEWVDIGLALLDKFFAWILRELRKIGIFAEKIWAKLVAGAGQALVSLMEGVRKIPGIGEKIFSEQDVIDLKGRLAAENDAVTKSLAAQTKAIEEAYRDRIALNDRMIADINARAKERGNREKRADDLQEAKEMGPDSWLARDRGRPITIDYSGLGGGGGGGGKGGKGPLDLSDIDQQIDRFFDKIQGMYKELTEIQYDFWIEQSKNSGDFWRAEELEIERWAKSAIAGIDDQVKEAERSVREIQQKIDKAGSRATPAATAALAAAQANLTELEAVASKKRQVIWDTEAEKYKAMLDKRQRDTQKCLADIAKDMASISGTQQDLWTAEAEQLRAELADRLAQTQKYSQEWFGLQQLYAEKIRQANIEASGSFAEGFKQAAKDINREMMTTAQVGKKTAEIISDGLGTFLTDIATRSKTTKDALMDLVKGVLASIIQMMAQRAVQDFFGLFSGGRTGTTSGVTGGASVIGNLGLGLIGAFGGMRAEGGPTYPGKAYIVGEKGRPEWFVPDRPGYITPNNPMAGTGGNSLTMSVGPFNFGDMEPSARLQVRMRSEMEETARRVLREEMGR